MKRHQFGPEKENRKIKIKYLKKFGGYKDIII